MIYVVSTLLVNVVVYTTEFGGIESQAESHFLGFRLVSLFIDR